MEDLEIQPGVVVPSEELTFTTSRASGPGGQHVNTTDSKVTVRFNLPETSVRPNIVERWKERLGPRLNAAGDLVLHSDRFRSQHRNKDDVIERLVATLKAALVVERPRRETRPSRNSQRRRIAKKKARGQTKSLRGRVRRDE